MGNADHGAQGQFAMGGREAIHVKDFAAGSRATMKFVGVVGGVADLVGFVLLAFFGVIGWWVCFGVGLRGGFGWWRRFFGGFGWCGFGTVAGV